MHKSQESFLQMLRCPQTHQPLHQLSAAQIKRLNTQISKGQLHNQQGTLVDEPVDDGLLRHDGLVVYPMRQGVFNLNVETHIVLKKAWKFPAKKKG